MGYEKIPNLYQVTEILDLFKELFALEKIHGTSAKFIWKDGKLTFNAGGEKHRRFVSLFDEKGLTQRLRDEFGDYCTVIVYGEAYGGKQQGMSATYGGSLRFVAFEVKIDGNWLNVPNAEDVVGKLGCEFVHYVKGPATLEFLNEQRDAPSVQAQRNGIAEPRKREGVVLRPLIELTKNNGKRVLVKHKRDEFRETKTPRVVDPAKLKVLEDAKAVADEWVVAMRLEHVIGKMMHGRDGEELTIRDTSNVIKAMIEDIRIEAGDEIKWSKSVSTAIGGKTAPMFKSRINKLKSEE
jgi:hypothetical protein